MHACITANFISSFTNLSKSHLLIKNCLSSKCLSLFYFSLCIVLIDLDSDLICMSF